MSGTSVQPAEAHEQPVRFVYVDDGVPEAGTRFLREACAARDVAFVPVDPRAFAFEPESRLEPGDLLYRPAISLVAQKVEQALYAEGVATFYADPAGPYFGILNPTLVFERSGIPVPRTIFCHTTDRKTLRAYAERLGGFPLIVKATGFSSGMGVVRVDSMESFFSVIDLCLTLGRTPNLMAYVPDATHWRMVVVGDRVVASYRNTVDEDDFRTHARRVDEDYHADPPAGMAEIAARAPAAQRLEMGGVDLLHHGPSERTYVLESNFPCYFAQAQDVIGVDTAGAMLDHLLAKREQLLTAS